MWLLSLLLFFLMTPLWSKGVAKDEFQTFIKRTIFPLRSDGKIKISKNFKHIKLDIGLSYNEPFNTHPAIEYIKIDAQGADLDIAKDAGS